MFARYNLFHCHISKRHRYGIRYNIYSILYTNINIAHCTTNITLILHLQTTAFSIINVFPYASQAILHKKLITIHFTLMSQFNYEISFNGDFFSQNNKHVRICIHVDMYVHAYTYTCTYICMYVYSCEYAN